MPGPEPRTAHPASERSAADGRRGGSPPGTGSPEGRDQIRAAARACGLTRRASSRRPPNRSPGTKRPVPAASWWSTSARGSAATRWLWRHDSKVLAVDLDQGMCRRILYNAQRARCFGDECCRSGHGPSNSRSPPVPGFISTRTGGHRGSRRASRLADYSPGPDFWNSAIERVAAGAIKLSPAADFSAHFAALERRNRADQPARRMQGGDGLVR